MPIARFLLVALLAAALPASAMTFAAADEAPAPLGWAFHQEVGPEIPTDLGVARQVVSFVPLGDIDADGHVDILMQTVDLQSGAVAYQAVSGAALTATAGVAAAADAQAVWRVVGDPGSALVTSGDLDADGVADHLLTLASGTAATTGQAAAGAAAHRITATGEIAVSSLGGVEGQIMFAQDVATSLDKVKSGVTGTVGVVQERATEQSGQVQAAAQGAVFLVEETTETTKTTLLGSLPVSTLTEVQNDVTLAFMDASGAVQATVELADPNINIVGMLAADVNLDGKADAVVMQLEKVSPLEENPAVKPILTAFNGASGSIAWEVAFDAVAGMPMMLPALGDLDADGIAEIAVLEQITQAGTEAPSSVVSVFSGASGRLLGTIGQAQGVVGLLPLGDLGASGAAALKVVQANNGATVVAAVDAQLEEVWTIDLPSGTVPLNGALDPFTKELAGFQDWTLDGVPDLAVGAGIGLGAHLLDGTLDIDLHSGVIGTLAWQQTFDKVVGADVVADVSASTSHDLALVRSTGALTQLDNGLAEAEGLVLELVRGADGVGIWRLPLVDTIPDGTAVLADVSSIGDIDADGIGDLQVHLEFTADAGAQVVHTGAARISTAADATGHTYLLSGLDGSVIANHADAAGELSVPLQETGPVQKLAGYRGAEVAEAGEDSPMPLAIVVAALVLAMRRRR